jgi:hypothetical protein
VRSGDGERLASAGVWHGSSEAGFLYLGGGLDASNRQLCVRPPGAGEWFVEAPGYRVGRLVELAADEVVVLDPAVAVELVLTPAEVDAPLLACRLVGPERLPGRAGLPQVVRFDDAGRCALELPQAGAWTLEWVEAGRERSRDPAVATQALEVPLAGGRFEIRRPDS